MMKYEKQNVGTTHSLGKHRMITLLNKQGKGTQEQDQIKALIGL